MKRNFAQVQRWMEHNFPELQGKVSGANFPPPPLAELALKILGVVQMFGMAFALLGTNVFSLIGMSYVPSWYDGVRRNGVQIAIFIYLLIPQILSGYMVSGAFEISLDGELIYSKLGTGRLPQFDDLVKPLLEKGLRQAGQ